MTGAAPTAPDPAALAAAVSGCASVAGLHAGPVGTYLPGHRIAGVSVDAGRVAVHIDLAHPATVADAAAEVTRATTGLLAGHVLDLYVDDVVFGDTPPGDVALDPAPTTAGDLA